MTGVVEELLSRSCRQYYQSAEGGVSEPALEDGDIPLESCGICQMWPAHYLSAGQFPEPSL
jgi:hypothetical protein